MGISRGGLTNVVLAWKIKPISLAASSQTSRRIEMHGGVVQRIGRRDVR
jgi:hypothetical protein